MPCVLVSGSLTDLQAGAASLGTRGRGCLAGCAPRGWSPAAPAHLCPWQWCWALTLLQLLCLQPPQRNLRLKDINSRAAVPRERPPRVVGRSPSKEPHRSFQHCPPWNAPKRPKGGAALGGDSSGTLLPQPHTNPPSSDPPRAPCKP